MVKSTEYQHAYRGSDDKARAEFLDNVDYAHKRRLLESLHIQSPFQWDEPDPTDLPICRGTEEKEIELLANKMKEKVYLVPDKCSPERRQPAVRKVISMDNLKRMNRGVQVDFHGPVPQTPTPPRSKSASPMNTTASSYFRSYRPFLNDLPPIRRSSVEGTGKCYHIHEHSLPEEEEVLDGVLRPPEFTPYALGNKAKRASGKRTYNVRADHGVFSTALRASAKRTASLAYNPPSSAPYGSPNLRHSKRRGYPCPYEECRCSKNYSC